MTDRENPGYAQSMGILTSKDGPFWMSAEEQEKKRKDAVIQGVAVKQKLTKKELQEILLTYGITAKGRLAEMQKTVTNLGILIEQINNKILEGWEGKLKGLLQVLWERGWINNKNKAYHNYNILGKKNEYSLLMPVTSLKSLMAGCMDFEEEETMLQYMVTEMGAGVVRSLKCYAEITGKGIVPWILTMASAKQYSNKIKIIIIIIVVSWPIVIRGRLQNYEQKSTARRVSSGCLRRTVYGVACTRFLSLLIVNS
jgi:hypothetical protein